MKANDINIDIKSMTASIEVGTKPKMILVSGGEVKELDMPDHGQVTVKIVKGRIQKFDTIESELF